jgi:hypothetical protein
MKLDTTTWVLIIALVLLLLWEQQKKSAAAAGSLSGGYLPGTAGAAGAAGKTSFLQQLLGGTGNTQKPPAGISVGGGSGGSAGRPTSGLTAINPWKPPALTKVPYASSILGGLIPSNPPPVYNQPTMNYPGEPIATIPSDTSSIFISPDVPPDYTAYPAAGGQTTSTFSDSEGNILDLTGGGAILQGTPLPVWNAPEIDYPGSAGLGSNQTPDPTFFSPVDTQTIDTTNLGEIAYQDPGSYGGGYASGGGYTGGWDDGAGLYDTSMMDAGD